MKCPHCGQNYNPCEVRGCTRESAFEAWFRNRDGFNITTGLIQRLRVCEYHIRFSIGLEGKSDEEINVILQKD